MRNRLVRAVFACVVLLNVVMWLPAVEVVQITGAVADRDGNRLPNAVITLTCKKVPDFKRVVSCDEEGTYSVELVDGARLCSLRAEAPGHEPRTRSLKLDAESPDMVVDFALRTTKQAYEEEGDGYFLLPGYKEMDEGRSLYLAGDLEGARLKYEQATRIVPEVTPAWMGLAEITDQLGDREAAYASSKRCLELDESSQPCLVIAINTANRFGHAEEYSRLMRRYQELNPEDPTVLFNRAVEYLNEMDDEQARPLLERCLVSDPEFSRCALQYGMLLLRAGELEEAKTMLREFLRLDPEGPGSGEAAEVLKHLN